MAYENASPSSPPADAPAPTDDELAQGPSDDELAAAESELKPDAPLEGSLGTIDPSFMPVSAGWADDKPRAGHEPVENGRGQS